MQSQILRNKPYSFAVAAVGSQAQHLYGDGWQIGAVTIDNTTGTWLYVTPANRLIPPNTVGWSWNFHPTTKDVAIQFVAAPPGGIASVQNGGPVVAVVYEAATGAPPFGDNYALPALINQLDLDIVALGGKIDLTNTTLGSTNTKLDTLNTNIIALGGKIDLTNTTLGTTNTKLDTLNTSITTLDTDIRALTGGFGAATTLLIFVSTATNTNGIPQNIITGQVGKSIHLVSVSISIVNLSVLPWDTYTWGFFDTGVILVSGAFSATTKLYDAFDFGGQGLKGTVGATLQFVANNLLGDTGMALQYTLQYYFA